jgi:hypothetical protein
MKCEVIQNCSEAPTCPTMLGKLAMKPHRKKLLRRELVVGFSLEIYQKIPAPLYISTLPRYAT